ncbi:hypothetical protein [Xanthomonas sp. 3075]|uniref:hypothetical protein n=1 Tax=Xanthomonas sp. 3075 TaxID=3035315 RepID=UPI00183C64AB|nr:hypothetical protein [Xanthomonas sp. 3075]MBB4132024.1 hypothetical protein [Xanthomonas sp. 3075]
MATLSGFVCHRGDLQLHKHRLLAGRQEELLHIDVGAKRLVYLTNQLDSCERIGTQVEDIFVVSHWTLKNGLKDLIDFC